MKRYAIVFEESAQATCANLMELRRDRRMSDSAFEDAIAKELENAGFQFEREAAIGGAET